MYVTVLIPPPLGLPHSIFGGTSACWLLSCFHNPLNSDMDYRIFNVHTWSFGCVRMHRAGGLGTPTVSQHNLFDSEKLSFPCAPDRIQTLDLWISTPTLQPMNQPVAPHN